MDFVIFFVHLLLQSSASVFFTVELEKGKYYSEFGGEVQMGCRFQPVPKNTSQNLLLSWYWITPNTEREVYRLVNGEEHLPPANSHYQGRVSFQRAELSHGWAKLKLSALRINDSGIYQCLVESGNAADYKEMTLSVTALYKNVSTHIQHINNNQVQLTCESKGFPVSPISWTDSKQRGVNASTYTKKTQEQLIEVVSHAVVSSSQRNSYTCQFERGGSSQTFHIPDDLHHTRQRFGIIAMLIVMLLVMAVVLVVFGLMQVAGNTDAAVCYRDTYSTVAQRTQNREMKGTSDLSIEDTPPHSRSSKAETDGR